MDTQTIILAVLASSGLWKLAEKVFDSISAKRSAKNSKNDDHIKIKDLDDKMKDVDDKIKDLDTKMKDLNDTLNSFIEHSNSEDLNQEKHSLRTQLMILMNHYPDNVQEILTVAHRYFVELDGDWYYTGMFKDFCENNNIQIPDWFKH